MGPVGLLSYVFPLSTDQYATADGIVHLYRNYDDHIKNNVETVTSFRALNTMVSMRRGSGLILDWQQSPGIILAAGDSRVIRAWDAHREYSLFVSLLRWASPQLITFIAIQELETQSNSPVTSICSDPDSSVFMAGFGDGTVKVFDRRLNEDDAITRVFRGHTSWVQNVRWQKGIHRDIMSARYA